MDICEYRRKEMPRNRFGKELFFGCGRGIYWLEYGVYTGPDRVKNFRLQYWEGTGWKDIEETIENNARYTQSFFLFKTPVTSSRIRFIATDKGSIKVREIKLFDEESVKKHPGIL